MIKDVDTDRDNMIDRIFFLYLYIGHRKFRVNVSIKELNFF